MTERILHNKIRCKQCQDVIESTHRHDFKYCGCGAVFVDGGHEYLRRGGELENIEELYEHTSEPLPLPLPRDKVLSAREAVLLKALFEEPRILGGKLSE